MMRKFSISGVGALVAVCVVSAPMASAQLSSGGGPIEITADRFELDDLHHEAIYDGNVDVIQGQSRIRAKKVVVRYRSKEEQSAGASKSSTGSIGALKEIEAIGEVYYVTPAERVKSDKGVYSADREIITLSGNVRVTNADGVIAGSHLVIDLTKGRYVMDGGEGRVKSVFDNSESASIQ